jgi:hypothetical protein
MPMGYGKLPIFDQLPLVLPLRILGNMMLGINLHWLPGPLRYKFCLLVGNIYDRTEPKEQFRMIYLMLKSNPALAFCLLGLRKYYISRCMNVIEIPGEEWDSLPIMSTTKFRARYLRHIAPAGLLK